MAMTAESIESFPEPDLRLVVDVETHAPTDAQQTNWFSKAEDDEMARLVGAAKAPNALPAEQEAAFSSLFRLTYSRIVGLIRSHTKPHDDAEGLAQEVYIKAWRGLERFEGRSRFSTWLSQIATNTVNTYHD